MTLCGYKRFGKISGHWCNECPPSAEYVSLEKKESALLLEINKKLREKAGGKKKCQKLE